MASRAAFSVSASTGPLPSPPQPRRRRRCLFSALPLAICAMICVGRRSVKPLQRVGDVVHVREVELVRSKRQRQQRQQPGVVMPRVSMSSAQAKRSRARRRLRKEVMPSSVYAEKANYGVVSCAEDARRLFVSIHGSCKGLFTGSTWVEHELVCSVYSYPAPT